MQLRNLKDCIKQNILSSDFMIFVCPDGNYIADTYVKAIAESKNLIINHINSLSDLQKNSLSLVLSASDQLNVLVTDTFSEDYPTYFDFENTIVICKKIEKKLVDVLADFTVQFPAVEEWQVRAYVKNIDAEITDEEFEALYKGTKKDIYRLTNELDKIKFFEGIEKHAVLYDIINGDYSDLYSVDSFELVDMLAKRDTQRVHEFLRHKLRDTYDVVGLSTLLLDKFKKNLLLNYKSGVTAADLGLNNYSVKYYKGSEALKYSEEELIKKIEFLMNFDFKLKSNLLIMTPYQMLDYLIVNMLM